MSILSLEFLVLVAALLVVHYCLPVRVRWVGLLVGSMAFYLNAGWEGLVYLPAVTLVPWAAGLLLWQSIGLLGNWRRDRAALEAPGDAAAPGKNARRPWLCVLAVLWLLAVCAVSVFKGMGLVEGLAGSIGTEEAAKWTDVLLLPDGMRLIVEGLLALGALVLLVWGVCLLVGGLLAKKREPLVEAVSDESLPDEAAPAARTDARVWRRESAFRCWLFAAAVLVMLFIIKYAGVVCQAASENFEGWAGCIYLSVVTAVTWLAGLYMARSRAREKAAAAAGDKSEAWHREEKRKRTLAWTVLLVIGGMAFIKYYDLIHAFANWLYVTLTQSHNALEPLKLIVPLGLSYFTFQSVGYVIDCARGKVEPEKNPLKYMLFVSFFPQITQGPITTYKQLMPQLEKPARFDPAPFVAGFQLALWGYFKKMVLADRLATVTTAVATGTDQRGWFILLGVVLYAIRLYADFSGGMDVIRGVAKMLGVEVTENFRRPFFSTSVAEYWRRWHISLGTWFRSYLFYPLTTSRFGLALSKFGQKVMGKKVGRTLPGMLATFLIFFLIGVWHVANWNAVIYGAYFGILLSASMALEPIIKSMRTKRRKAREERAKLKAAAEAEKAALAKAAEPAEVPETPEAPEVVAPVTEVCEEPREDFLTRFDAWLGRMGNALLKGLLVALRLLRTWLLILLPQYFAFTAGPKEGFSLLVGTFRNWDFTKVGEVFTNLMTPLEWYIAAGAMGIILIIDLLCEFKLDVNGWLSRTFFLLRWVVLLALILAVLIFGCYGEGFDAAAFLYTQF